MAEINGDTKMEEAIAPTSPDTEMANGVADITINGNGAESSKRLPVTVTKPIPYTFDLGNLMVNDANPLPSTSPAGLHATARDCAQSLLNNILSTLDIVSNSEGVHVQLPDPSFPLPREKPLPKPKEPTKWERFAAAKGITKGKERQGKMVYDEETKEWVPRYGYKGANKKGEDEWLVEVDEKKEARTGEAGDARMEHRAERKEKMKRQERRERSNAAKATKGKRGG